MHDIDLKIEIPADLVVTREMIDKLVAGADQVLSVAKTFALFTNTKVDDQVVDTLKGILDKAKPYLAQDWVVAFLNFILGLFKTKTLKEIAEFLMKGTGMPAP